MSEYEVRKKFRIQRISYEWHSMKINCDFRWENRIKWQKNGYQ